ncbi:hypothetical protein NM688_g8162 [Phlebia brevispora]|uniref:Uncharacterized protein n=1 Tax=Phlebia brevispora TaxID=194682 RepID=A0ACC1RWH5_9APHY|nr:hypothetical protein NM688_g8162 [Phlebia brevispora]
MARAKKRPHLSLYEHEDDESTTTTVHQISGDWRRRRINSRPARIVRPSPPSNQQQPVAQDTPNDLFDPASYQDVLPVEITDQIEGITVVAKEKARRYESSDVPLKTFLPYRDEYLDDMLFCEGRGLYMHSKTCPRPCCSNQAEVRCKDCFGRELLCGGCMVTEHTRHPLHRVESWTGTQFVRNTLTALGLRLQLGHRLGEPCQNHSEARELMVIDVNGIHELKVAFCGCRPVEEYRQLLQLRWWPATPLLPRTAFTFNLLRQFHYQNLQGNITAFDFYRSLEFLTDGRLSSAIP